MSGLYPQGLAEELPGGGRGEGRDRPIVQRRASPRTIAAIAGSLALLGAGLYLFGQRLENRGKAVSRGQLAIAEARVEPFQESISATGLLSPRTTVFLDLVAEGRIEQVSVREGALVRAGQEILRLSNNALQLQLLDIEARRLEQMMRLGELRAQLRDSDLDARRQLTDLDFRIQELQRKIARNAILHEHQLISEQEVEQAEKELEFLRSQRELALEQTRQSAEGQAGGVRQMEGIVSRSQLGVDFAAGLGSALVLKAPVDGLISSLAAEVGEFKTVGSRLGQIDRLEDGFKVRAEVDEYYLERVAPGQRALTRSFGGREFPLRLARIFPEIREGKFAVDLEFEGAPPDGLKRGQSVAFQLKVGEPVATLQVPNSGFLQSTGGRWLYVLESEDRAVKRAIRPGRVSSESLEVLEGLAAGDRVIVSSYELLGDREKLSLASP